MIEGSLFYVVYTVPCFEGMSYVDIRLLFHLAERGFDSAVTE